MPIALNCACGVHLEIDDKFAGKTIPCPDCARPLLVVPPAPPKVRRVNGLAVASLTLSLTGFFTLIGSLAGAALGYLAQQQIARDPERYGGQRLAAAGLFVGAAGLLLTLAGLFSNEIFGVDVLLREIRMASELDYNSEPDGRIKRDTQHNTVSLARPSPTWAELRRGGSRFPSQNDLMTLVNLWDDAHLVVLSRTPEGELDADALRAKAVEWFRESDLAKNLSRLEGGKVPEGTVTPVPNNDKEATFDVRLGGRDRTFLIRVVKHGPQLYVLAGGTRKNRFPAVVEPLRQAFDSFKVEF